MDNSLGKPTKTVADPDQINGIVSNTESFVEVSNSSIQKSNNGFKIGDIVWSKIGRYPFWPSIICNDPEINVYTRRSPKEKTLSFHIRFCNDNGRRSWSKTIEHYFGKDDILLKYPDCLSSIKKNMKQQNAWNLAVKEADILLKHKNDERLNQFFNKYKIEIPAASTSEISTVSNPIDAKNNALLNSEDPKISNTYIRRDKKVIKPKKKCTNKPDDEKNSKYSLNATFGTDDPSDDKEIDDNTPSVSGKPSTKLHQLPSQSKKELRNHLFETKFIAARNQTKHLTTNNPKHAVQDHVDIVKKEKDLNKINIDQNNGSKHENTYLTSETDMSIDEESVANETYDENETNEASKLENLLSDEMLLEELHLVDDHCEKENLNLLEHIDEEEKNKKFEGLLLLLKNSTKITDHFEARLKNCKTKIIQKELENVKNMKKEEEKPIKSTKFIRLNEEKSSGNANNSKEENLTETRSNESNVNISEEDNSYLNLFEQPKLFNGQLKNFQIEGLLWIRTLFENGVNGILADDMGLGKTIQTIAFYCFLIEMRVPGPFLVIAPLSTVTNWMTELLKFAPSVSSVLYHGPEKDRKIYRKMFEKTCKVNNLDCYPVVVTTYEVVRADISILNKVGWKFITIDEGHKLKNFNASISKCIRQFNCTNKLILSGTPIQNNMMELWSLLNLLMPDMFNNMEDFNQWFVIDNFFESNDKIASMAKKNEILDIMLKILKPFILRREKKDTDLNLPPKKEIVIFAPMTEDQQNLYKATLNKHIEILLKKKKETDDIMNESRPKRKCVERIDKYTDHEAIMKSEPEQKVEAKSVAISVVMQNPFAQLKKIANHPYLVHMPLQPGTKNILVDENIIETSGKFLVLDAMLTKLEVLGHKVCLFSTMTQLLDVIAEFLEFRSYKYSRLDGTMSIQKRVDAITYFNTTECFLMIISTRAGGLGINLTSADTVIIFDSDWNPQCDLQAQDRCHRMGQTNPVVVYRLCSKNTVDERILDRAVAKRKLEKMIMGNGSFKNSTSKFNVKGMEELINLLESSDYNKKIQSNGFIFTDEELDGLLDRSDMLESAPQTNVTKSAKHFKVLTSS